MEFLRHIRVRLAGAMVLIAFIVFAFIASLPAPPPEPEIMITGNFSLVAYSPHVFHTTLSFCMATRQ